MTREIAARRLLQGWLHSRRCADVRLIRAAEDEACFIEGHRVEYARTQEDDRLYWALSSLVDAPSACGLSTACR